MGNEQKPIHPQKLQKATTQKRHQKFDNTTIANEFRMVNWSDDSHPTGVVTPVNGVPTFPLTTNAVLSKGHAFKDLSLQWYHISFDEPC